MEIVFAGRSNIGKSSLIRCLTGRSLPVGRKPGVTRKPTHLTFEDLTITDLPGFGFMSGRDNSYQEWVKDEIVHYIEKNAEHILLGFVVVDARSFLDIVNRWSKRGEIPVDLEMYDFLCDVGVDTRIIVNKIDKIKTRDIDGVLDSIGEQFNMDTPWQQWNDIILPVSAKKKDIHALQNAVREKLVSIKKERLLKYFRVQKC